MNETISNISNQVTEYWKGFTKQQKIKIFILIAIIISVLGIIIYLTTRPKMVSLFSDLTPKQTADIQEVLNENNIKNKTVFDATGIKVEAKDLDRAKMLLAKANIPNSGFTFEDALENSMGTTETIKKAKLKYAKEQELSRGIAKLEGIDSATVNLVIPDDTRFFIESQTEARASIQLTIKQKLSQDQIMGIVRYVAQSVENLEMKNISVIDQNANLLYGGEEDYALATNADKQYELELIKKKEIKNEVIGILAPLFDDVRVTMKLEMDFDTHHVMEEEYASPQGAKEGKGLPKYEEKESTKTTNTTEGAEPGVIPNTGEIPEYAMGDNNISQSKTDKSSNEYYVNKKVAETSKSIGNPLYDHSSLTVIVYRKKVYDQATLEQKNELQGLSWQEFQEQNSRWIDITQEEDIQNLVAAVQKGTGILDVELRGYEYPEFRGKTIQPFREYAKNYMPIVILLIIIGLLAYGIIKGTAPEEIIEVEPELSIEEMLQSTQQKEPIEEIEYDEQSEVKKQIDKFVDEKPEAVAQLLRNWLSEDWE
ncbi:MAG: flagellar M-ring protein FliF [Epulopiscium sp.]|nr:flagellar M-ring protein FliF [Candidatus Epulonipiscium sp.]